ncbi:MAG: hypothetical protein MJ070_10865 [Lachnospiraceae bacterium]|nr:hypothetical protein [Lachnospiraceae bacterium]
MLNAIIIAPMFFLIILGVIGLVIYLVFYNKKANARLTGEYDPETGSRIPSPSSALSVLWKIAVVVCFIILFVKLGNIADDISSTTASISNLNSRINSINYNVEERINQAIEEQNKLFLDYGYRILSTDWDKLETEIEYYVVPKEISEDASITLQLEGKDYPTEKTGGEWTAHIFLNPFQSVVSEITATVTENGTIKNETWYDDIYLKHYHSISNSKIHYETIEKGMITVLGDYEILLPSEIGVKNVKLTVKNGDTVIRTDTVPETVPKLFYDDSDSCFFGAQVNDQISVKNGDVIIYTLSWESEKGLYGETELYGMEITIERNNAYVTERLSADSYMLVFDKNGNRLD